MRAKNEMESRLYLRLVRACFILAAVVMAFGVGRWMQRDVYALSWPGGEWKASSLNLLSDKEWSFYEDTTIIMDEDASCNSISTGTHDLTIKGNKTLTINGNDTLITANNLTVEDTTLKLTVNEESTGTPFSIYAEGNIALKNVNMEVDNPIFRGVFSDGDTLIAGGSVKIKSEDNCIHAWNGSITVYESQLNLKSNAGSLLSSNGNINIQNTTANIDSQEGLWAINDINLDNSELQISCRDNKDAGLISKHGKIVLSENIYVKSPHNTKICQAEVGGQVDNNVLCNVDGTPVTSCIIAKKRVSDDICKISAIPAQNFTGAAITPAVTATWNGTAMKEGTDFTVTYKNNTNAGTATATVAGKGIYTGTKDITFTIKDSDSMPAGTKVKAGGQEYKVINATTVAFTKAKNKKSVTVPATITANGRTFAVTQINAKAFKGKKIRTITIGKNVAKIKANAFKGSPATKLILKTKLLKKKTVKNALKGSKIKTAQVKVGKSSTNKKIKKAYKKFFTKKVLGRKVTLK